MDTILKVIQGKHAYSDKLIIKYSYATALLGVNLDQLNNITYHNLRFFYNSTMW